MTFEKRHFVFSSFSTCCAEFRFEIEASEVDDNKMANVILQQVKKGYEQHHKKNLRECFKECNNGQCSHRRLDDEIAKNRANLRSILALGEIGRKLLETSNNIPDGVALATCNHPSYGLHVAESSLSNGTSFAFFSLFFCFHLRPQFYVRKSHTNFSH